jgi:hypothetical protein
MELIKKRNWVDRIEKENGGRDENHILSSEMGVRAG